MSDVTQSPRGRAAPGGQRAATRALADEQAALRRIATLVASEAASEPRLRAGDRGGRPAPRCPERERAALRARRAARRWSASWRDAGLDGHAARRDAWTLDGDTVDRPGLPQRRGRAHRRTTRARPARCAERLRALGYRVRRWPRRSSSAAGCGACWSPRRRARRTCPTGAEQRLSRLRRARRAGAVQRRRLRQARRLARADRGGRRRRAAATGAQPPRRRPAAARGARSPAAAWSRRSWTATRGAARAMLARRASSSPTRSQELRELARGIHPAVLTDRGLGPPLARSPTARRCRWRSRTCRTSACPSRSRPPPTTSSPRR